MPAELGDRSIQTYMIKLFYYTELVVLMPGPSMTTRLNLCTDILYVIQSYNIYNELPARNGANKSI